MARLVLAATLTLATITSARAQVPVADGGSIDLIVREGTALRVALDARVAIQRAGQPIGGSIVEPVFAYDRIVIPAGTNVRGHIASLAGPTPATRVAALLRGDLTPLKRGVLVFDTLLLNGQEIPIQTVVTGGAENVRRLVAAGKESGEGTGVTARARHEVGRATEDLKQKAKDALSAVRRPGRFSRLRDAMLGRLPVHRQYLTQGTVYSAELLAPLDFGIAAPIERAAAGTEPAPESILSAQLVTALDSSKTPRGTPITAVLTAPVFSANHRLILPQGSSLVGTVTLAKQASHFHRNGQLRFLFERVQADQTTEDLLASLYSVEASLNDHVVVDNEGGTAIKSSKTRFLAPALALFALRAASDGGAEPSDEIGAAGATSTIEAGNVGSHALGGFMGFGLIGTVVSQVSRPFAWGFAVAGAARSVYTSVFGKGKDVSFPAHTPIEVQLAPGPEVGK